MDDGKGFRLGVDAAAIIAALTLLLMNEIPWVWLILTLSVFWG